MAIPDTDTRLSPDENNVINDNNDEGNNTTAISIHSIAVDINFINR